METDGGLVAHGVVLGDPASLLNAGLAVAHPEQAVSPPAAAAAQQDRPGPHRVHPGKIVVHQGVGAGGVDDPGLKAGLVYRLHHPVELLELLGGVVPVGVDGVDLGINAREGHVGQIPVDVYDLLRLPGQEAAEAQAGIHLDVGLGHGGAGLRRAVEGEAGVHRAHGAHHIQVQQAVQLLPVGGGAEHENLLVHQTGLAHGLGLLRLGHGKAADALLPEKAGQLRGTRAAAVPGEDPVDGGAARPLFHHGNIVFQGFFLQNQCFHSPRLACLGHVPPQGTG